MKKLVFLLFLFSFYAVNSRAQSTCVSDKWNIKACYSSLKDAKYMTKKLQFNSVKNYRLEVNYGLSDYLEMGVYTGYSLLDASNVDETGNVRFKDVSATFYGVNTNIHILPFFGLKENSRINLYISGKYGGYYVFTPENYVPERGHSTDYGIYVGTTCYLLKHIGLFAELGYGKNVNLLYGLTFKF